MEPEWSLKKSVVINFDEALSFLKSFCIRSLGNDMRKEATIGFHDRQIYESLISRLHVEQRHYSNIAASSASRKSPIAKRRQTTNLNHESGALKRKWNKTVEVSDAPDTGAGAGATVANIPPMATNGKRKINEEQDEEQNKDSEEMKSLVKTKRFNMNDIPSAKKVDPASALFGIDNEDEDNEPNVDKDKDANAKNPIGTSSI